MKGEEALAQQIAETIGGWLASGKVVARTGKPIKAGDVLVLVQRRGGLVQALIQACTARQIPTSGLDRLRLNTHLAVWDMIALLEWCADPQDDMALANILLSPLGGMDYEALTALCVSRAPAQSLWEALRRDDAALFARCEAWRSYAQHARMPSHIITYLLWQQGMMQQFIARFGEGVREILTTLIARLAAYETTSIAPTLQESAQWLRTSHTEIKRDLEHTPDKVRIMTVHGAKGLEAPIVVLADAHALPQDRELFLPAPSEVPSVLTIQGDASTHSGLFAQAKERNKEARASEYWRLLYVALTRACDELHIFGVRTNRQQQDWYSAVESAMDGLPNVTLHEDGRREYSVTPEDSCAQAYVMPQNEATLLDFLSVAAPTPHIDAPSRPLAVTSFIRAMGESKASQKGEALWESALTPREIGNLVHGLLEKQVGMEYRAFLEAVPALLPHVAAQLGVAIHPDDERGIYGLLSAVAHQATCREILEAPALAEASFTGMMQETSLIAQCDRIIMQGDVLHIVDIKVAAAPAEISEIDPYYVAQLATYKQLLNTLFPRHVIMTSLLYIHRTSQIVSVCL